MGIRKKMKYDVATLKNLIRESATFKEKFENIMSLILKDLSIVVLAVLFISTLNRFFGAENSAAAVVIFCIFMFVKSVDFGYNMKSSIFSLFIIFMALTFGTYYSGIVNPALGFIINIISVGIIALLGCQQPIYGSAGLFLFGYVFMYSNPVSDYMFKLRVMEMAAGFIICATVFYINHRKKLGNESLLKLIKGYSIFYDLGKYHLQIVLGLSLSLFIGEMFNLPRVLWVGCACMSVVSQYGKEPVGRFIERLIGVVIGSVIFTFVYMYTPDSLKLMLGLFSGFCLGLCSTYKWSTAFNSFGALLVATEIYGLRSSVIMRVGNNLIGCIFGFVFYYAFHKFMEFIEGSKSDNLVEDL